MEQTVYLIAGLGNPGREYARTRHNVGYMALDAVAGASGISIKTKKFEGVLGEGFIAGRKTLLIKPCTFMNLSGHCVRAVMSFYRIPAANMLVLCDDFNLPLGTIRLRKNGSSGGQKGLISIIRELGTEEFPRLRIGIGAPPPGMEASNHVLGRFSAEEMSAIDEALLQARDAAHNFISDGMESTMCRFNTRIKVEKRAETEDAGDE